MSRRCEYCERRTRFGNKVTRRGKAKYLGGVGRKITGKSRRTFKANIQRIRIEDANGVRRVKICTQCMRSGKVRKPVPRPKVAALAD